LLLNSRAVVYQDVGISDGMSAGIRAAPIMALPSRIENGDHDFSFVAEVIQTKQQTNIYFARK
jgi:hypothetical protein